MHDGGRQPRRVVITGLGVVTSIDPEILLFDEGIGAVDAAFLEKAKNRLQELVSRAGLLVFASHSDEFLRQLCTSAIWMNHGTVKALLNLGLAPVQQVEPRGPVRAPIDPAATVTGPGERAVVGAGATVHGAVRTDRGASVAALTAAGADARVPRRAQYALVAPRLRKRTT